MKALKVAVIGVGHLGKEHARIYKEFSRNGCELTGVCDISGERAQEIGKKLKVPHYTDYRELLGKVDAVSVATPTIAHYEVAIEFLKRGIPALVEKPITKTVTEAKELVDIANKKSVTLAVGHVERFNPAFEALSAKLKTVRFIECHRLSPFRFRSTDIDVVMDLMIHDLDIILHLVRSPIKKVDAVGISLLFGEEDIANARIEFESGCVANVTASRISDKAMRKMRVFSEDAYTSIDFAERSAKIYKLSEELAKHLASKKPMKIPSAWELLLMPKKFYSVEEIKIKEAEPLAKELEAFLNSVRQGTKPPVSGEDGLLALQTADAILKEIREHKWQ